MKKIIFSLFSFVFFLTGCNEENIISPDSLSLDNFSEVGLIHNAFLSNAKVNFQTVESISSVEDKIEFINQFNLNFLSDLDIDKSRKEQLRISFSENKDLVRTDILTSKAFYQNQNGRISSDDANIFQSLESLNSNELISDFGYSLLLSYSNDIKSNYEGTLSDSQLKSRTLQLISNFEAHGYPIDSGEGIMIGNILAISIASIEWWEENPDAFDYDSENGRVMIAPWAAADIVGAAWGGATGAIGSYAGTGEVNWTAVGVGALSGAIAGSTGAVGKIAKWLF